MVCKRASQVYVCTGECFHKLPQNNSETNSGSSLICYLNLCDSVGSDGLQMQKGVVGMLNRSCLRKSKLSREKIGFLGALDIKVNGFMRWQ